MQKAALKIKVKVKKNEEKTVLNLKTYRNREIIFCAK